MTGKALPKSQMRPEFAGWLKLYVGPRLSSAQQTDTELRFEIASCCNMELIEHGYDGTNEEFYAEASYYLKSAGVVDISASGETLRRWMDLEKFYSNLTGRDVYLSNLSQDHFFKARTLSLNEGIKAIDALDYAIANECTADEMLDNFSKKTPGEKEWRRFVGSIGHIKTYVPNLPDDKMKQYRHIVDEFVERVSEILELT